MPSNPVNSLFVYVFVEVGHLFELDPFNNHGRPSYDLQVRSEPFFGPTIILVALDQIITEILHVTACIF